MDTSGFYKYVEETNELLYAPNFVYSPTVTLLKEHKDTYNYPDDGWYWFNSQETAYDFFDYVPTVEEEIDGNS